MPAGCQRMPESWLDFFSATNAHTEHKIKKAVDNHMWRDHQKETYLKWHAAELLPLTMTTWRNTYQWCIEKKSNSNAMIVTYKSYKPIHKRI